MKYSKQPVGEFIAVVFSILPSTAPCLAVALRQKVVLIHQDGNMGVDCNPQPPALKLLQQHCCPRNQKAPELVIFTLGFRVQDFWKYPILRFDA